MFFIKIDDVMFPNTNFNSLVIKDGGVQISWDNGNSHSFIETKYPKEAFECITKAFARAELLSRIRYGSGDNDKSKIENSEDYAVVNVADTVAYAEVIASVREH